MEKIKLLRVKYLPRELEQGVLYVSEEFGTAGHLCACGCKSEVITPLGETEWAFSAKQDKATLYPSIGNWQLPCRSHYWIRNGFIEWSYQWNDERILQGRKAEESARQAHFDKISSNQKKLSVFSRFIRWLFK